MSLFFKKIIMISTLIAAPLFGGVNYEKLSNQILKKCIKEVEKKYPISVMGTGGAGGYDIEAIVINYRYRGEADIAKARRLYIEIAEIFIKAYNSNKELRPYLHNYPFTHHHLSIAISFDNIAGKEKNIDCVHGYGDVEYSQKIAPQIYQEKTLCTESYEAALEIVRKERDQELLQTSVKGTI